MGPGKKIVFLSSFAFCLLKGVDAPRWQHSITLSLDMTITKWHNSLISSWYFPPQWFNNLELRLFDGLQSYAGTWNAGTPQEQWSAPVGGMGSMGSSGIGGVGSMGSPAAPVGGYGQSAAYGADEDYENEPPLLEGTSVCTWPSMHVTKRISRVPCQ